MQRLESEWSTSSSIHLSDYIPLASNLLSLKSDSSISRRGNLSAIDIFKESLLIFVLRLLIGPVDRIGWRWFVSFSQQAALATSRLEKSREPIFLQISIPRPPFMESASTVRYPDLCLSEADSLNVSEYAPSWPAAPLILCVWDPAFPSLPTPRYVLGMRLSSYAWRTLWNCTKQTGSTAEGASETMESFRFSIG